MSIYNMVSLRASSCIIYLIPLIYEAMPVMNCDGIGLVVLVLYVHDEPVKELFHVTICLYTTNIYYLASQT